MEKVIIRKVFRWVFVFADNITGRHEFVNSKRRTTFVKLWVRLDVRFQWVTQSFSLSLVDGRERRMYFSLTRLTKKFYGNGQYTLISFRRETRPSRTPNVKPRINPIVSDCSLFLKLLTRSKKRLTRLYKSTGCTVVLLTDFTLFGRSPRSSYVHRTHHRQTKRRQQRLYWPTKPQYICVW